MFDRVLILTINIGGGHFRAAQALQEAFRRLGAARDVRIADTMQYTSRRFRRLFLWAFCEVVCRAPEFYGWLYDHFDRPARGPGPRNLLEKLNAPPVLRLLEECRPDVVICMHALPAGIISWLRGTGRTAVPHAVVTTDFGVHALWVCDHCEQYFVASDDVRLHLEALGVPGGKVAATGIPIDPVFADVQDPAQARRVLGLEPDRATILVTSGGWGFGPVERTVQCLRGLQTEAQVVVVCARNGQLKTAVDRMARDRAADGLVRIASVGWTSRMHTYLSAADLVAGKAGGLTTSEALAKGLPFLIINPIKGQEERNADYLLEEGAAVRCDDFLMLAHKVDKLFRDPDHLARLRANARRLARPHAACDIVRALLHLAPGAAQGRTVGKCRAPDGRRTEHYRRARV